MQKHFWGIGLIVAAESLATLSPCPAAPPADQSAILVGAGDIADCKDLSGAEATAKLLENVGGTVMVVGDLAYPDGSKENFTCYDKTWGRARSRTRSALGNHEFHAAGATPYFDYFGVAAGDPKTGYYSYELGPWHHHRAEQRVQRRRRLRFRLTARKVAPRRSCGASRGVHARLLAQTALQFRQRAWQRFDRENALGRAVRC